MNKINEDITKSVWYADLVEKCKKEPNKKHSSLIENDFLNDEEYKQLLDKLAEQLYLLPDNAQIYAKINDNYIDLATYKEIRKFKPTKISQEKMDEFDKRFRPIELDPEGLANLGKNFNHGEDTINKL